MHLEALTDEGKEIFTKLKPPQDFYLAGGTALALQIGHRISQDFDFFSQKPIKAGLLRTVEKWFGKSKLSVSVNNTDELTLFVDGVKITFLCYPFPVLRKLKTFQSLQLLSVEEIAATKAYTIGRRGSYKDYVDLYSVLTDDYTTLERIMYLAAKKYRETFSDRLFLEQLVYWKDLEYDKIVFLHKTLNKQQIQKFFEKEVKQIKLGS
jgi:predicted nucleotidyltransferase component of viral defense system